MFYSFYIEDVTLCTYIDDGIGEIKPFIVVDPMLNAY